MSQKLHQSQSTRPRRQSCAALAAASHCFFSALFSPLGAVHHEPLRLVAHPHFLLDAGFPSCTRASIRLNSRQIRPNSFFAGFRLALVGFLVVQCLQIHLQGGGFVLAGCLKFQVARLPSEDGLVQLGLMWRRNVPMFGLSPFPPHQTLIVGPHNLAQNPFRAPNDFGGQL